MKGWGSSRDNEGQPKNFVFLDKYRRVLDRNGTFFQTILRKIVRRTISFYNKQSYVSAGGSSVYFFQMFAMGQLDINYFFFSLFLLTVRSF